jgi:hypothetical protein
MVFRADGMNGKKAKKLFTKMTKAVPSCAFAVISMDAKGKAALFCACGKDVALDGGAKKWAATVFPEGRGEVTRVLPAPLARQSLRTRS